MKILQAHNFYKTRGGECSVVRAERALLEEHGHEVIPYYRDSRDIDDFGSFAKVRMLANVSYSRSVERNLVAFVQENRPDVAHIHNVFPLLTPAVYAALKKCGVPIVQTVHNFRFLCPNGQFFTHGHICELCQERGYLSAVTNRCMRNSVLVSAAYAAAVARAWKSGIIPNSIDVFITLNKFFSDRLIKAGVKQEQVRHLGNYVAEVLTHVPSKQGYFLYLGRLSREKGLHTLLDAWVSLDGVRLKIAGTGPLEDEIRDRAGQFGANRVEVLGHIEGDMKRDLLMGALGVIAPSEWYENFPISVVESMAHGTPVLATRIGGLPELVVDGVTGLLFEPGDANALAAAVKCLVTDTDLAIRLAAGALAAVQQSYGPSAHYEGLMRIYQDAAHARRVMSSLS